MTASAPKSIMPSVSIKSTGCQELFARKSEKDNGKISGDSICKIYPNSYIWALMKIDNIGDSIFQSTKYNLFFF